MPNQFGIDTSSVEGILGALAGIAHTDLDAHEKGEHGALAASMVEYVGSVPDDTPIRVPFAEKREAKTSRPRGYVTSETPAETDVPTIKVDQWAMDEWMQSDMDMARLNSGIGAARYLAEFMGTRVEGVLRSIDAYILNALRANANVAIDTVGAGPLASIDDFANMNQILSEVEAPMSNLCAVGSSSAAGNYFKIGSNQRVDEAGTSAQRERGLLGMINNIQVYRDTGLNVVGNVGSVRAHGAAVATVNGAHPAGSRTITVDGARQALVVGDTIEMGDGGPVYVVGQDFDPSGTQITLATRGGLRSAVSDGTVIGQFHTAAPHTYFFPRSGVRVFIGDPSPAADDADTRGLASYVPITIPGMSAPVIARLAAYPQTGQIRYELLVRHTVHVQSRYNNILI